MYSAHPAGMILMQNNTASQNGTSNHGFRISGDHHQLVSNVATKNGADGFNICGPNNTLTLNTATGDSDAGIDIDCGSNSDGNVLTKNTAKSNVRNGIEISSGVTNTAVTKNTAKGNGTFDFCDEGTGTTTSGNTFGTTSAGPCAVD